jgi:hypothetical protein
MSSEDPTLARDLRASFEPRDPFVFRVFASSSMLRNESKIGEQRLKHFHIHSAQTETRARNRSLPAGKQCDAFLSDKNGWADTVYLARFLAR